MPGAVSRVSHLEALTYMPLREMSELSGQEVYRSVGEFMCEEYEYANLSDQLHRLPTENAFKVVLESGQTIGFICMAMYKQQ